MTITRHTLCRLRLAAVTYGGLTFVAFLLLVTYNTWSPGTMGTELWQDNFEARLALTWVIWGVLPAAVLNVATFATPFDVED